MFTNSMVAASSGPSGGRVSFAVEVFAQSDVSAGIFVAFGGPQGSSETEGPPKEYRRREAIPSF